MVKRIIKHIIIIATFFEVLLLSAVNVYGQEDTLVKYINIEGPILYAGEEIASEDTIEVSLYLADTLFAAGQMAYKPYDSIHVIELPVHPNASLDKYLDTLKFTYFSQYHTCSTGIFSVDNRPMLLDSKNIFMSNLHFEPHEFRYPYTFICSYEERVEPITNIPIDELFVYSIDSFIILDNDYAILPIMSIPGTYELNVETGYCYTGFDSNDIINISGEESTFLLPDTLSYCAMGPNSIDGEMDFTFASMDDGFLRSKMNITESGYYLVNHESQPNCGGADTAYVEIIKPLDISLDIQNNCKYTTVNLIAPDDASLKINWSNKMDGRNIQLENSEFIYVEVYDELGCVSVDSANVEVVHLVVEEFDYSKEEADCWKDGELAINQVSTNYGADNINYRLINKLTNVIVKDLEHIPDGIYQVELSNADDCSVIVEEDITILQKCLEDYPVFSPNMDGLEDEYFIPHEGSVQVFDRSGILVKELNTPVYWDGTDEQGNLLPMGNYLIVTDSGRPVNITIVR